MQQYALGKAEKPDTASKPEEGKEVESPVKGGDEEAGHTAASTEETAEANSAPVEESTEAKSAAAEDSSEASEDSSEASEDSSEDSEDSSEASEDSSEADKEVAEVTREIELETSPADFRFPTTNQTRHCFTRSIEYHRCVAAKGEDAKECDKFAKYYRSSAPHNGNSLWKKTTQTIKRARLDKTGSHTSSSSLNSTGRKPPRKIRPQRQKAVTSRIHDEVAEGVSQMVSGKKMSLETIRKTLRESNAHIQAVIEKRNVCLESVRGQGKMLEEIDVYLQTLIDKEMERAGIETAKYERIKVAGWFGRRYTKLESTMSPEQKRLYLTATATLEQQRAVSDYLVATATRLARAEKYRLRRLKIQSKQVSSLCERYEAKDTSQMDPTRLVLHKEAMRICLEVIQALKQQLPPSH